MAYWDLERKKPTHRRKVVDYYDEEDNLIETGCKGEMRPCSRPMPKVYTKTIEMGKHLLCSAVAKRTGLSEMVARVFNEDTLLALTCTFYIACYEGALCHCEQWSTGSNKSFGERLGDQRISELLTRINGDRRALYLHLWMEKLGDSDNYALGITSTSSYIETIKAVRARYNRDGEDLEQINMALLIGSRSRLTAYYSFISNNVNDKTFLKSSSIESRPRGSPVSA